MSRAPPGLRCLGEIRALSGSPERAGCGNGQASGAPLASRRARPFVSGACNQSRGAAGKASQSSRRAPGSPSRSGSRLRAFGRIPPLRPQQPTSCLAALRLCSEAEGGACSAPAWPRPAPPPLALRCSTAPCVPRARLRSAPPPCALPRAGPAPAPPRRRCALGRPLLLLQWWRRRGGRRQRRSGHLVQPGRMETPGGAAPPGE